MKKQNSLTNIAITVCLLVLCAAVFFSAGGFKGESGMFPKIVASVTFVLCCLQLGNNIREFLALPPDDTAQKATKTDRKSFLLAAATLVGYVVLIFVTGYYPATAIYLCASMFLFGYHKKLPIVFISVGMLAFIYVLFTVLMRVHLPSGLLF